MKKKFLTVLSVLLFSIFTFPAVHSQELVSPQVRYASVEGITLETIVIMENQVNASHFIYTFALFKVENWADKCYFKVWVDEVLVAEWAVGFSANMPPGLQGIYPKYDVGLVRIETIMGEFPFGSAVIVHPEDGEQTYYFYRMHFYFDTEVFKGGEVRVAGDYEQEPTFQGSELTVLVMQNSKFVDGVETFKYRTVKNIPPGWAKH